jgi:hypothetical protein
MSGVTPTCMFLGVLKVGADIHPETREQPIHQGSGRSSGPDFTVHDFGCGKMGEMSSSTYHSSILGAPSLIEKHAVSA